LWFATSPSTLFRSTDNGESWEAKNSFPADEIASRVRVNRLKRGQLALITNSDPGVTSKVYTSDDGGETLHIVADVAFAVNDVAFSSRNDQPLLFLAADNGLFELSLQSGAIPVQISVDGTRPTLGFTSVASAISARGTAYVAVAARTISGPSVFLSAEGGLSDTYQPLGLKDSNVSELEVEKDGLRTFLWAGLAVRSGSEAGKGAVRWELQKASAGSPTFMSREWKGGSCHRLAFSDRYAFAATHDRGVMWLDTTKGDQVRWYGPLLESGLPLRNNDLGIFQPVTALAVAAQPGATGEHTGIVMAGGAIGISRSLDDGTTYELCSAKAFHAKP
jgi:hypothetical protein